MSNIRLAPLKKIEELGNNWYHNHWFPLPAWPYGFWGSCVVKGDDILIPENALPVGFRHCGYCGQEAVGECQHCGARECI